MNSTEKKALAQLSMNLKDVQDFAKTLLSTVDYLKDRGTAEDNVQKIFEDNLLITKLEWLKHSVDNVKMLMEILK